MLINFEHLVPDFAELDKIGQRKCTALCWSAHALLVPCSPKGCSYTATLMAFQNAQSWWFVIKYSTLRPPPISSCLISFYFHVILCFLVLSGTGLVQPCACRWDGSVLEQRAGVYVLWFKWGRDIKLTQNLFPNPTANILGWMGDRLTWCREGLEEKSVCKVSVFVNLGLAGWIGGNQVTAVIVQCLERDTAFPQ